MLPAVATLLLGVSSWTIPQECWNSPELLLLPYELHLHLCPSPEERILQGYHAPTTGKQCRALFPGSDGDSCSTRLGCFFLSV